MRISLQLHKSLCSEIKNIFLIASSIVNMNHTRGVWNLGLSVCHIFFMAKRNDA